MSFWGERYDKEDVWDDIKYWFQNPVTPEEQAMREQEKQRYIDYILDIAYPNN